MQKFTKILDHPSHQHSKKINKKVLNLIFHHLFIILVQPLIELKIKQSKSFMFTDGIGWNWHKSWNIPDFIIELDLIDPQTNDKIMPPEKITVIYLLQHYFSQAELTIVKTVINETSSFHLQDVGIRGQYLVDMENGKAIFSGLKFDSTSYSHNVIIIKINVKQHSKFHLVISIYVQTDIFQYPQIIESKISPPIFIDSRKTARDSFKSKNLFSPEILEKAYIKRDSKLKVSQQEEINNDIDGLIKYFTAANIRNKVRHPLFLGIRFNSCIVLYINEQMIKTKNEYKFIEEFQHNLMEDKKFLIVAVESNNKLSQSQSLFKKIKEILDPLENNDCLEIVIDPVQVPKGYKKVTNLEELQNSYKYVYPKLIKQKYEQEEQQMDKIKQSMDINEDSMNQSISKVIVLQGDGEKQAVKQNQSFIEKYYLQHALKK